MMKYKCMDINLVFKTHILNGCQVGESSKFYFLKFKQCGE